MIQLSIPDELVAHCEHLTARRNYGRRPNGHNGNHKQQMTGTIGESMIRSLFGKPWMSLNDPPCADRGCDIDHHGIRIDVKTTSSAHGTVLDGVQHYHAAQQQFAKTDVYLFTNIKRRESLLIVVGWITHAEFIKNRYFLPAGMQYPIPGGFVEWDDDQYLIENRFLHMPQTTDELISQMNDLKI